MATPGAPNIQLNPQATANALTFYWQKPSIIGGGPITNYVLLNQNNATSTFIGESTYGIQISTLTNKLDYNFQLAAINEYGQGPYANFITAQPGTIASPVTNVVATVTGINTIAVNWNYVSNENEGSNRAFIVTITASTVNFSSIQKMAYPNQSSILISDLPINTTSTFYTAAVQVVNDVGWSHINTSNSVSGIGSLALWLDGNDINYSGVSPNDGFKIDTWIDKSGNGRKATYGGGYPVVKNNVLNNLSAVFLNGASYLNVTYNNFPIIYTVFTVQYLSKNTATYQRVIDSQGYLFVGVNGQDVATFTGNGSFSDLNKNTPNINNFEAWTLISLTVNSNTITPYVNGIAQNSKSTTTASFNSFYIGGFSGSQYWNGYVGEILIYNLLLNTTQRQEIEGYLATKWNLQSYLPNSHPYYAASPTNVMLPWVPAPLPTQPLISSFTNISGTTFTINWTGAYYASSYTFTLNANLTVPTSQTNNSATFKINPNTFYSVQITAVNQSGTSSASSISSITSGPGEPTNVTSSNVTATSFQISWSGASGATSFTYTLNGISALPSSSTAFSAIFTNLMISTTYTIVVTSVSATGRTQSNPIQISTLGPSKPTAITVSSINTTGFTITWSGGTNAVSYNYLLNNVITVATTDNGIISKSATFTTLNSGTNYSIIVQATDVNGITNSSQSITHKTLGPLNPNSVWETAGSASGFTVNWLGGDGATSYSFTINGSPATPTIDNGLIIRSASFSGLTVGTVYSVVVTAINFSGSASSAAALFYTSPTNPTNVTASNISSSSFTITWSGGNAATSFTYDLNGIIIQPSVTGTGTATFTGLNGGIVYSVIVTAINIAGSASSSYTNQIPLFVSTNQLWLDGADPFATGVQPLNGSSITNWYDKSGFGYNAIAEGPSQYVTNSLNSLPGVSLLSSYFIASIPSGIFTNATAIFTVYKYTGSGSALITRSSSGSNRGIPYINGTNLVVTNTSSQYGYNDYVSSYDVANTSPSVFSLILDQAENTVNEWNNGSQITVTYQGYGTLTPADIYDRVFIGTTGDNATTFAGIFYEILIYNVALSTENRQLIEGYLAWKWGLQTQLPSNHPYFTVELSTYIKIPAIQVTTAGPSPPTSLDQNTTITTGFRVTWSGGTGATSYQYYINNILTTPQTDNGVASKNAVFTGLESGTQYTVIVRAINADGGSNSIPVIFFTQMNQPTGVSSSGITSSGFTISWSAISGPTNLRISLNGNTTIPILSTSTSATFSGLLSSTIYTVIVSNVSNVNVSFSNQSTPLTVATLDAFTPKTISNNILWVDGADPLNTGTPPANGAAVTTWFDKSGNSNNMTATVNGTYAASSQNGLGTVTFASSVYRSAITNISYYPGDAYIVVKVNSLTTANDICGISQVGVDNFNSLTFSEYTTSKWHNGSAGFSRTPNAVASVSETSTSFLIMSWSIATNNFYIYRNGVQIVLTASYSWTPPASVVFCLGTRVDVSVGNRLIGSIAEAAVYTTQLNTTNRQKVEGYLAWKWGLQTQLPANHPFFTLPP